MSCTSRGRTPRVQLLLLLLPFLLFWRVWWPDAAARQVFRYGDFVEQHYPMRVFVADEYRHGRLPLWDPYTFGGEPAVAMSLFAPYYPPGLWQVLFEQLPFEALEIEAIFHLGLAGLFTFLFVRRATDDPRAGFIAGLAFSLGGYLTSYPMLQIIILETAVWLPAGLWLLDVALEERSVVRVALAGVLFGFGVLAGHPQTFLYIAYLAAAYFLFRAVRLQLPIGFVAAAAVILAVATLGISAGHWLPGLQMYGFSPRAGLSYDAVANGFRPAELWGLLRPNPGQWSPLYVGIIPLALALVALALRRRAETWFWASTTLIALLLSLGRYGFLYPLFYRFVPGFAVFRDQERIALVVSFGLAVLAGYGVAALADAARASGRLGRRRLFSAPGAIDGKTESKPEKSGHLRAPGVSAASFFRHRSAAAWDIALALFIFADLAWANQGVILQEPPPGGYFARTPIVTHIQSVSLPGWRTSSEGLLPGDGEAGLVFKIRDIVGSGPLYLAAYDRFLAQVPEERWWRMLNVQHLITRRDLTHGALKLVRQDGELRLYQVFQAATLAWIVHDFELAADQEAAIRATASAALDPFARAVLERPADPMPAPPTAAERVELVSFENQRVAVDVVLTSPGILVLSEMAYPGWVVRANDQAMEPLRVYAKWRRSRKNSKWSKSFK
ncbi:MAG: hypothetical protein ACP5UQ_14375, partial [Anaerolineae bacterium]